MTGPFYESAPGTGSRAGSRLKAAVLSAVLSAVSAAVIVSLAVPAARAVERDRVLEAYELLKASRYDRALPILSRVIEEDQANTHARRYLAYALLKSGKPVKSAEQILMMRGRPCSFDYYILGEAYRSLNRPVEAERCFQLVLSRDPGYEAARAGLINVYEDSGDSQKAMQQCILGRQLSNSDSSARFFSRRWATVRRGNARYETGGPAAIAEAQPVVEREEEPIVEMSNNEAADLGISGTQAAQQAAPAQPAAQRRRPGLLPPPPPAPRSGPFSGSG